VTPAAGVGGAAATFEKFEVWQFSSPSATGVFSRSLAFWQQSGYATFPTGPGAFQGRSVQPRWGFHRVVDVAVYSSGPGAVVQVRFRASLTDEGLVAGAVVGLVYFPAAVVGGAVSWHEYEEDWQRARWAYWNFLVGALRAQPAPGTAPAVAIPPPPAPPPVAGAPPPPPPPPPSTPPAEPG
jgi:hypothetical protein